jgi:hypothetical protein
MLIAFAGFAELSYGFILKSGNTDNELLAVIT